MAQSSINPTFVPTDDDDGDDDDADADADDDGGDDDAAAVDDDADADDDDDADDADDNDDDDDDDDDDDGDICLAALEIPVVLEENRYTSDLHWDQADATVVATLGAGALGGPHNGRGRKQMKT